MFEPFDNLSPDYIPDNMHHKHRKIEYVVSNENIHKKFNGDKFAYYYWEYGEDISLEITANTDIKINNYDIINSTPGVTPPEDSISFVGRILDVGTRFYNLVDVKSWRLSGYDESSLKYYWEEDEYLTFFNTGTVNVTVTPDMSNRSLVAEFLNHKNDVVFETSFSEVNNATVTINGSDSSKYFPKGNYTLLVSRVDNVDEEDDIVADKAIIGRYKIWVK